jgi:peptidylprolyl isomerase
MKFFGLALWLGLVGLVWAQTVTIKTDAGDIVVELYPEITPKAVENFTTHAQNGYYDGLIFHRVIPDFMIQGGDPTGTGRGGESIWKKPFEDEFKPNIVFDRAGILAMANAGPSTNGSQFFITTVPTPWLNGRHTIFGEVIEGMDVVRAIERTPTGGGNKPKIDQKIITIEVEK